MKKRTVPSSGVVVDADPEGERWRDPDKIKRPGIKEKDVVNLCGADIIECLAGLVL